jgi:hypothetical protein
VNRVFKLKLNDMIRQLRNGTIFSKPDGSPWKSRYIMWVVEFQKRGLPHAHIAVRLEGEDDAQPNDEPDMPNDVLVCDVRSGGKEVVTIPSYNKWWELLMYPLLFPTGAGGHYNGKMPYAPQTTTGKRVTLFQYVCRMFYQYEPLTLLGRLAQEWGLNNFQRYQGDVLNFQLGWRASCSWTRERQRWTSSATLSRRCAQRQAR